MDLPVEIDEDVLKDIAASTVKIFQATDNNSLLKVYEEIDQLENRRLMCGSSLKRRNCSCPCHRALILLFRSVGKADCI